jgi:hypothetical protein
MSHARPSRECHRRQHHVGVHHARPVARVGLLLTRRRTSLVPNRQQRPRPPSRSPIPNWLLCLILPNRWHQPRLHIPATSSTSSLQRRHPTLLPQLARQWCFQLAATKIIIVVVNRKYVISIGLWIFLVYLISILNLSISIITLK